MAAGTVARVILRCESAQETQHLDLSDCQLIQVPDAVYHLMRNTELKTCNLSSNVISKIPPKFAVKFSLITELNLSNNQMSKLPDELSELAELQTIDLSHNNFTSLPNVVFKMPKLSKVNASNNQIIDVEVERIESSPSLEEVDLQANPLRRSLMEALLRLSNIRVRVSPEQAEDWDQLDL